jgi:hypothetical protein
LEAAVRADCQEVVSKVDFPTMDRATPARWNVAALNACALVAGVLTGVALVTAYTFASGWIVTRAAHVSGSELFIPLRTQVDLALWFSALYGTLIAVFCAPLWLLLEKRGYSNVVSAMILGFVAPIILWIAINQNGVSSLLDLTKDGLPYGFCGSGAGLVACLCRLRWISA